MARYVRLSYALSETMPFFDGLPKPRIDTHRSFSRGDAFNSFYFTTSNHAGTHVDAPQHFVRDGRPITDYAMDELVFTAPTILDLPLAPSELIGPEHIVRVGRAGSSDAGCDLLLIRTGFGRHRDVAPATYVNEGPGFSRAGAEQLLESFPLLRAIGVDFISIAATAHQEEGAEAHRVLLGHPDYGRRSVLLIEDLWLPPDLERPSRVFVAPLFFEGLDSAPCTVFAEQRA